MDTNWIIGLSFLVREQLLSVCHHIDFTCVFMHDALPDVTHFDPAAFSIQTQSCTTEPPGLPMDQSLVWVCN